jgi:SAM-dependent methyltransferase
MDRLGMDSFKNVDAGDAAGASGHWPQIARQWSQVGPPLRPSARDLVFCAETIGRWARENGAPRALILGVTAEFCRLPWPRGTDLLAVDHTQAMIDYVWPGSRESALCADWITMPLKASSRDIVLCDGGFHTLPFPQGQRDLIQKLQQVVAPGGLCICRFYMVPERRASVDSVLTDLLAGKIPNLNVLKIRLWMAHWRESAIGVELGKVWEAVHRVAPDFAQLASRIGWSAEHLSAIDTYRDCTIRYYFFGMDDIRRLFCQDPGGFEIETTDVPDYELGEQCPTVVLRRRAG